MTHHAKATSAGSTGAGTSRGPLRRALATRGGSGDANGSGAPSSRRAPLALLTALALIASLAFASSASADSSTCCTITNVSYASAHVTGKVTAAPGFNFAKFEYSTDGVNWTAGSPEFVGGASEKEIEANLTGLKGGTKYFLRLTTSGGAISPGPNPSFTTLTADPTAVISVDNASEVAYTTAKAEGKIKRPEKSDDVNCHFEYVTDKQFNETGFDSPASLPCEPQNPVATVGAEVPVSAKLSTLDPATTYHLRLAVSNAANADAKDAPSTFTTLAVAPPSVVSTDNATEVEYTQAQVKGVVERPANADPSFDVECNFEYVTDEQFTINEGSSEPLFTGATPVACNPNPVTAADTAPGTTKAVSATLGGLTASTTYHLRLAISNKGGSDAKEAAATFTTNGPIPAPTITAANDATDVSYKTAKVSGTVERPAGADPALNFECRFEYITDEQFAANPPGEEFAGAGQAYCAEPITSAGPTPVSAELTGLLSKSGVTYHLRLVAENAAGVVAKDATNTFTTLPGGEPSVTPDLNPVIGYTTARVSAVVERGLAGSGQTVGLTALLQYAELGTEHWGPAASVTPLVSIKPVPGPQPVTLELTGLTPGTAYEFRLGLEAGGDFTPFSPYPTGTTKPVNAPTATLDPVTTFTGTSAHLSGTVSANSPGGLDAEGKAAYKSEWHFECTPECPGPGGEPFSGTVQAEEGSKAISADVITLHANTFYEVKLVAHNVLKTVESTQTFQTPLILPDVKAEAGASDGEGGYILQGIVNSNNSKVTSCTFEYGTTATYPNTYKAACLPNPSGPDEVQNISIDATEGQFKLSFRGQTTSDLPYNATTAEVQTALRALSQIGPAGVNVTGSPGAYVVTFAGKLAGANVEPIKASDGTTPLGGGGGASVSTGTQGGINHPVTIEAHVENLTVNAHYHFRIFTTNAAGSTSTADREFIPILNPKGPPCPNEQLRKENNSLALPECRAYEKVTPSGKEGFPAEADGYAADTVLYDSFAGNLSGSGAAEVLQTSQYVAVRTATGWETIPNLNGGPGGSKLSSPDNARPQYSFYPHYSADFHSSLWLFQRVGEPADREIWLKGPDGSLTSVGRGCVTCNRGGVPEFDTFAGASDDLSHIVYTSDHGEIWGPGVYEFVGTGNEDPRRVDLDNTGAPISTCVKPETGAGFQSAEPDGATVGGRNPVSADGRVIFITSVGSVGAATCTGTASPPADEVWARIGGTTSVDASASQCHRTAPAEPCNAPSNATFLAATPDGSRVFFSTKQQLLDADTDQTNDIYECDIPSGTPSPIGKANACDALREVSGAAPGADVEKAFAISEDGSTVYFISTGVLASNEDALGNTAQAGDRNLYVWRTDASHPDGQTRFVARLTDSGLGIKFEPPETTPDSRYLLFLTATPLLPTDTDESIDLYRYDDQSEELTRVSTGLTGVGGNGPFDVQIGDSGSAISDDGQKVVFSTPEPLSPVDGNNAQDVYLWTPGKVSLITTGSVGGGEREINSLSSHNRGTAAISSSGRDIFFATAGKLVASDGDQSADVYDARVDGGFTNPPPGCSGESCQPPAPTPPPLKAPGSGQPSSGNPPQSKPCPKGKVKKHGKCVKKSSKKHSAKKHHKPHKKAGHNRGGSK